MGSMAMLPPLTLGGGSWDDAKDTTSSLCLVTALIGGSAVILVVVVVVVVVVAHPFAKTQVGRHKDKRESCGRVIIIDPWGRVLGLILEIRLPHPVLSPPL